MEHSLELLSVRHAQEELDSGLRRDDYRERWQYSAMSESLTQWLPA